MVAARTETAPNRLRAAVGMVAWTALLMVAAGGAGITSRGALAPPSLTHPTSWAGWADGRTPVEAAFAVLGMVVVALAWYLLAVSALVVGGHLWGAGRLLSVSKFVTLPVVRRALHAALGISLAGSAMAGAGSRPGPPVVDLGPSATALVASSVAVAVAGPRLDTVPTTSVPTTSAPAESIDEADEPPVMRRLPPANEESPPAPAIGEVVSPEAGGAPAQLWEVRPGDHLWSVAAQTLKRGWGRAVTDAEVAPYWVELVEANRHRLADPANADLIFPGQALTVPPSPPAPS